ncbi:MAG: RNA polymerase sigma factor SigZ [Leptolinea sp.]|jgi:RNA polymerase sigma-70 factor (ECF subfamily)|nr:RNA polymerase sigma factor SigZ [Leptolinea sp.]
MDISCQPCRDEVTRNLWIDLHDRLFAFIHSRLDDPDDVEDTLQDVFLKIHSSLASIRDVEKIESWVFQITRNCIADHYRKSDRQPLEADLILMEDDPGDDTAAGLAPYISEIVRSLPDIYREAILLTDYQGHNQNEAARMLGISVSGFKSRVQRARAMIKETMLTCCHFEFDARGILFDYREHCCCCSVENSQTA